MGYLEKLAANGSSEKARVKNEKEMASLQPKLEKAKRERNGAASVAD